MIGHGFGLLEGQDEEAKIAWFTSRGVISRGAMDQSETDSVLFPKRSYPALSLADFAHLTSGRSGKRGKF